MSSAQSFTANQAVERRKRKESRKEKEE